MAAGNRFMLTDVQNYLSQTVLNVYFYLQATGDVQAADGLAAAFQDTMLPLLVPLQNDELTHTSIQVINIDNADDWFTLPLTADNVGTSTSDGMPPYAVWAFRYNRTTRAVRNGQKRIGGVSEANVSDGVATGGAVTDLAALAAAMGAALDDTLGNIFTPRIFHRAPAVGTPPVYPPLSDGTDYPVASVEYVSVSTQNTRKFGRGS